MTNNTVNPYNSPNTLIITDKDQNHVIVTQPVTSIIEITAPGTQGPNISPETSILIISESSPSNSTVIQPDVKTITISATGVQGPAGPSPDTSSLVSITTFNAFTSSYTTGSFTGSFIGDGSQLTGIVSSKWTGSNPISRESNVEVTGSFSVTGGITGSFSGSGANLFDIPASGIVGLNLSQIASGSATASISPDSGLVVNTNTTITGSLNVSGTASATSFVGDGSQLTNLPIPPSTGGNLYLFYNY